MYLPVVILLALVALNIFATRILIYSPLATKNQKIGQFILLWIIPLFAILILFIHSKQSNQANRNFTAVQNAVEAKKHMAKINSFINNPLK